MTPHITARTAAVTDLATVSPMALDGLHRISTSGLSGLRENVTLYEENAAGIYEISKSGGQPVVLTEVNPSEIILAKGNYKCSKTVTAANVAVGYE